MMPSDVRDDMSVLVELFDRRSELIVREVLDNELRDAENLRVRKSLKATHHLASFAGECFVRCPGFETVALADRR